MTKKHDELTGKITEKKEKEQKAEVEVLELSKEQLELIKTKSPKLSWFLYKFGVGVEKNEEMADQIRYDHEEYYGTGSFITYDEEKELEKIFAGLQPFTINKIFNYKTLEKNPPLLTLFAGLCYHYGVGTPADPQKALELLLESQKSKKKEHHIIQTVIGNYYLDATGGVIMDGNKNAEEDKAILEKYKDAIKWYKKAVAQGNPEAENGLGQAYHDSDAAARISGSFLEYFENSSKKGNADSMRNVTCHNFEDREPANPIELLTQSAKKGNAKASHDLAQAYRSGVYGIQDEELAFKYFQEAVEKDNKSSSQDSGKFLKSLGKCYLQGIGTRMNLAKAIEINKDLLTTNANFSLTKEIEEETTEIISKFKEALSKNDTDEMRDIINSSGLPLDFSIDGLPIVDFVLQVTYKKPEGEQAAGDEIVDYLNTRGFESMQDKRMKKRDPKHLSEFHTPDKSILKNVEDALGGITSKGTGNIAGSPPFDIITDYIAFDEKAPPEAEYLKDKAKSKTPKIVKKSEDEKKEKDNKEGTPSTSVSKPKATKKKNPQNSGSLSQG